MAQETNAQEKDPQDMGTLEWILSKRGMRQAFKDFNRQAPVTAPILYASYVVMAAGLVATFAAGPLGFPAVAAAALNVSTAGGLTCISAMISHVAVSVAQDLGYLRKKPKDNNPGGNDSSGQRNAPAEAPTGPVFTAAPAAAAFNAESPKGQEQEQAPAVQDKPKPGNGPSV